MVSKRYVRDNNARVEGYEAQQPYPLTGCQQPLWMGNEPAAPSEQLSMGGRLTDLQQASEITQQIALSVRED